MEVKVLKHKLQVDGDAVPYVSSPNVGGALSPRFLLIHYTASGPAADIPNYFAKKSSKVSAHIVIDRTGRVTQCVPFNVVGWHAGKSSWQDAKGNQLIGLNSYAIGIEIENWGPLKRTASGTWVSWTKSEVDGNKVIEAKHKFGEPDCGWETFTEEQIESAVAVGKAICGAYPIEQIIGHDDVSPGRKSDPGPAWNMQSYTARVFGRNENSTAAFIVNAINGLNIRSGAGASFPTLQPTPLPFGTKVIPLETSPPWRYVSVLDTKGDPVLSGWVHSAYLIAA